MPVRDRWRVRMFLTPSWLVVGFTVLMCALLGCLLGLVIALVVSR